MAKRFTATEKWDKEWFMELKPKHKCLWFYLCDKCDSAGIWEVNYRLASMAVGEKITDKDIDVFKNKIVKIAADKIFLIAFIEFQYGQLSKNCKPHIPVIKLLEKHGLDYSQIISDRQSKGYPKGMDTLKEKEKETDKEKEQEQETEKEKENATPPEFSGEQPPMKIVQDEKVVYRECIKIYYEWAMKETGMKPAINEVEGANMKRAIQALSMQESVVNGSWTVPRMWQWILENLNKCDPYLQSRRKIAQINSELINIVHQIQHGTGKKGKSKVTTGDLLREFSQNPGSSQTG